MEELTNKEIKKYHDVLVENKIKCKCGHSISIPPHLDKVICDWCGVYVFRNAKAEFNYRTMEQLRKVNK